VNDTELIQRGEGLFTEGRWRKQSIAEILALNTHIKRHPSVESCGEVPRSAEQKNSHYVGHVCFIDRLWARLFYRQSPGALVFISTWRFRLRVNFTEAGFCAIWGCIRSSSGFISRWRFRLRVDFTKATPVGHFETCQLVCQLPTAGGRRANSR